MKKSSVSCWLPASQIRHTAYAAETHKAKKVDTQFEQLFNSVESNHSGTISKPEAKFKTPRWQRLSSRSIPIMIGN
jgi:hypothetical protein